ncbi:MAG: SusC/RagA family TonB-linked outer membrane protein, partial [Chitinophagaceae bacterium]|nr:SusC/RagA family TonB-linked outer membrane protein [Chitinophagaceae bacterium]
MTSGAAGSHRTIKRYLFAMNLTAFLILVAVLHVSAGTYSQKVTVKGKDLLLTEVFKSLRKQTGFQFVYLKDVIKEAKPVTLDLQNVELKEVLMECLTPQKLSFEITDKIISITPSTQGLNPELQEPHFSDALPPPITGSVRDAEGNPLSGVNVMVKGMKRGVTTDAAGKFSIDANNNDILIISSVGFERNEIKVSDPNRPLNILLKKNISKLDEVQIVGYGTSTQRYNVGSVSKVTAEEISSQPVGNPLAALQGRVPGLVITTTSGLPASAYTIQLRGQSSLKTAPGSGYHPIDNPLIIIDGVPFAAQNNSLNQYRSIGGTSDDNTPYGGISALNSINPSDIESIEVLKDADATAIYGSRAANGVILITTKKGKPGQTKTVANIYHGTSGATKTMRMMNTQEYLLMRREALKNDNVEADVLNSPDLLIFDTTKYTDWNKYFLRQNATTTDANLSVSGGSDQTSFLIGTGYHKETFVTPGDYAWQRGSVNLNLNHTSQNRKFMIGLSANYGFDKTNSADGTNGSSALVGFKLIPNYPDLLNPDGTIKWEYNGFSLNDEIPNPLQYIKRKYVIATHNIVSRLLLSYQLVRGLTIRSSFGFNKLSSNENTQYPIESQPPEPGVSGNSSFGTNNISSWIIEPQADYKTALGGGKLNVLVGGTIQRNISTTTNLQGSNYT